LERRGVEVDHTFYLPKENMTMTVGFFPTEEEPASPTRSGSAPASQAISARPSGNSAAAADIEPGLLRGLQSQLSDLTSQMEALQSVIESVQQRLERIERDLGV